MVAKKIDFQIKKKLLFLLSCFLSITRRVREVFPHLIIKTKKRNRLGDKIIFSLMLLGTYAEDFQFAYPDLSYQNRTNLELKILLK